MSDRQSLLGSHQQSWWFNEINYLLPIRKTCTISVQNNFIIMAEQTLKRGTMQIRRNDFSPELVKKIESMPIEELEQMFGISLKTQVKDSGLSQAKRILKAVNDPEYNLEGMSEEINSNVKEFRDNFFFNHDK